MSEAFSSGPSIRALLISVSNRQDAKFKACSRVTCWHPAERLLSQFLVQLHQVLFSSGSVHSVCDILYNCGHAAVAGLTVYDLQSH